MKKLLTLLLISSFTLLNSCDQSNSQLFDLILEIKSQNNQLLNEVKTLQLKSDLLIAELRLSAAKQEELLTKVTDLQDQLSSILSQIAFLNKQVENQNTDFQVVKDKLAELQTQYQSIVFQLQELQKLSQVLAEIEKMKTQISQLDTRYATILAGLVQNKQQLDTLKIQITSAQAQLVDNLTKIALITSQLGDQDVVIGNILKQIELIKTNNSELIKLLENLLLGINPVPTDGLVAYYPFNGNANDLTSSQNNGVVTNVNLITGKSGISNTAYSFNGNNNYITLTKPFFNGTKVTQFSVYISFYLNQLPASGQAFTLWQKNGFWQGLNIDINSDGSIFFGGSIPEYKYHNSISNLNQVVAKKWYNLLIVFNNLECNMYLNGLKLSVTNRTSNQNGTLLSNTMAGYFDFGQSAGGNSYNSNLLGCSYWVDKGRIYFLNGILDEFILYNRTLNQTEIDLFSNKTN